MPASVQEADDDATSPRQPKSNAWPTEERDDIYNRRQQGDKWDAICLVTFPMHRSSFYGVIINFPKGLSTPIQARYAATIFGKCDIVVLPPYLPRLHQCR